MEILQRPSWIRRIGRRIWHSPRFPYLLFLGLLGLGGSWQGYLHWWEFQIQQMLTRHRGGAFRREIVSASVKGKLGRHLFTPLEPITSVSLSPRQPMTGADIGLLRRTWSPLNVAISGSIATDGWRELGRLNIVALFVGLEGPGPTDDDLKALSNLSGLEVLQCESVNLEASGLRHLVALPRLRILSLKNTMWGRSFDRSLPREQWPLPTSPVVLPADALRRLAMSDSLQELQVTGARFGDDQLLALTGALPDGQEPLPTLTKLVLPGTELTSRGTKFLSNLPRLETLDLAFTAIDDDAIRTIGRIRTLKKLNLTRTRIGDASVETLVRMQALEELWVGGTAISDKALVKLIDHQRLRRLVVDKRVSEDTLITLRSYLPCYVDQTLN